MRFHRLDEAVPTSHKPEIRAERQWQGGPNTILAVGLTPSVRNAWQDQGKVDEPQPSEEGGGLSRIRGMARKKRAELTANAEQVSSAKPLVAIVNS